MECVKVYKPADEPDVHVVLKHQEIYEETHSIRAKRNHEKHVADVVAEFASFEFVKGVIPSSHRKYQWGKFTSKAE